MGDVGRLGEGRVSDRHRPGAGLDIRQLAQLADADNRHRPRVPVGDEDLAVVRADGDLVEPLAGGEARQHLLAAGVDDGDAGSRGPGSRGFEADPQVGAVGLEGHVRGPRREVDQPLHFPVAGVGYSDLMRPGQRHEERLAVGGERPVIARARQPDHRQELGAAEAEERVDDGDGGPAVECQDVVDVEVELGLRQDAAAHKLFHLLFALLGVVDLVFLQ